MDLFEDVQDIALFYFVGHGQMHGDELSLALRDSPESGARRLTTGLPFADVRAALRECPARTKILILDCCFAGQATHPHHTLAASADIINSTVGTGAFTMAATGATRTAGFESDPSVSDAQTFFTKYLIDVVEQGIPGYPQGLPLGAIFARTADELAKADKPLPTRSVRHDADRFIFARNVVASDELQEIAPPPPPPTNRFAVATLVAAFLLWPLGLVLSGFALAKYRRIASAGRVLSSFALAVSLALGGSTIGLLFSQAAPAADPGCLVWQEETSKIGERMNADIAAFQRGGVKPEQHMTNMLKSLKDQAEVMRKAAAAAQDPEIKEVLIKFERDIRKSISSLEPIATAIATNDFSKIPPGQIDWNLSNPELVEDSTAINRVCVPELTAGQKR